MDIPTTGQMPIHPVKRIPLREVFPHEAHNFTVWLEENIEALADELGLQLTVLKREHSIPSARIDLLCQDEKGHYVIVENQLEHADHWHLGQVLLYLVSMDAKVAIWVAADTLPEYTKVITWLNESTPDDTAFYLVKVEAISIAGSAYAPLFTKLIGPSETYKAIGKAKKDISEENAISLQFVTQLLTKLNARTSLFQRVQPRSWGWIGGVPMAKDCTFLWFGFFTGFAKVQLNIECDNGQGERSKVIFDALHEQKDAIEKEFGATLKWQPPDNHGVARIVIRFSRVNIVEAGTWPQVEEQFINAILLFEQIFKPRIESLEV